MTPYYQENGITIYNGDCREVLPDLSGVDQVLTSPPYNKGRSDDGRELSPQQRIGHYRKDASMSARGGQGLWKGNKLSEGYEDYGDSLPFAEYVDFQREVLSLCWTTLSDVGAIYYNHKPRVVNGLFWMPTELNPGLPLRQIVIWARGSGFNFSPVYYTPTSEWILIFAKPDFRLIAGSERPDVWNIAPELGTEHPAPFPLKLANRAIASTAAKVILDPFMGSGTTLRAAKDLGRKAIGVELNEAYCEIAANRLRQNVLNFDAEPSPDLSLQTVNVE